MDSYFTGGAENKFKLTQKIPFFTIILVIIFIIIWGAGFSFKTTYTKTDEKTGKEISSSVFEHWGMILFYIFTFVVLALTIIIHYE